MDKNQIIPTGLCQYTNYLDGVVVWKARLFLLFAIAPLAVAVAVNALIPGRPEVMRLMPMVQADDQMHVFLLVLTLQQFEHLVV